MALSLAASSVGRPLMTVMVQALGAVAGRAFAAEAASSQSSATGTKRPSSVVEPTYTYMPPGSSMREPLYFSTSDPVYFVDPKPEKSSAGSSASAQAEAQRSAPKTQDAPNAPSSVKKFDLSAIVGQDDGRPVSYRMVDDFSQQGYVVNPKTNSMNEPKYVSISEPPYTEAKKQ